MKFSKSKDGQMRADVRVPFRLSAEDIARVYALACIEEFGGIPPDDDWFKAGQRTVLMDIKTQLTYRGDAVIGYTSEYSGEELEDFDVFVARIQPFINELFKLEGEPC